MKSRSKHLYKEIPTLEQLEKELHREKYKSKYRKILRSTFFALVIVSAFSVLVATLFLPVLQIYGNSMSPTFSEGDIVVSVKDRNYNTGDIIAFYYNNHILVKRIVAGSMQWVNIDDKGNVYVDDKLLDEPYVTEKSYGENDIKYPYQVPENSFFVMGDHRKTSIDSRKSVVGCVNREEIVGKIIFRVYKQKT